MIESFMIESFMNEGFMSASFNAEIDGLLADIHALPNIIWAPIRHHSPECSRQLQSLIKQEKPDVILIEGPSEAEHLLPFMRSDDAKAPLAIYSYVIDPGNAIEAGNALATHENSDTEVERLQQGSGAAHYRCFAPFSAMSPEWVAIKAAQEQDIECHFIDLPYVQRLALTENPAHYSSDAEPQLYDDCLLSDTDYISTLLQQSQCRDFDAWWERFFESGQTVASAEAFFSQLLTLCLLIRRDQDKRHDIDIDSDDETLAREHFMAQQIRQHTDAGKRCLVVCGGFHCEGIFRFLQQINSDTKCAGVKRKSNHQLKANNLQTGMHLIPYSLARINKAADYSAGMPDSGYYHAIWLALQANTDAESITKPAALTQQVQAELAARLVTYLRSENQMVTLPDAIEAAVMAQRLAQLRGHLPGRREFRDALQSCFLKQAQDGSELHFNHLINNFLCGEEVGRVPDELPLAPLVQDFHYQCARFKLPLSPAKASVNSAIRAGNKAIVKTLHIYRKDKHRQLSQLLHQLVFLETGYAVQKAGPDFIQGKDLSLVRESWELHWQPEIEARIIECGHYGHTLADAALNKLLQQLNPQASGSPQKVISLLQALRMGLHKIIKPICDDIELWLQQEADVYLLCEAFHYLSLCYHDQRAANTNHRVNHTGGNIRQLQGMLSSCYQRICIRLTWLASPKEEQLERLTEHLNMLASAVNSEPDWHCEAILFYDALTELLELHSQIHPQIRGVSLGILRRDEQISDNTMQEHLAQAFGQAYLSAQYCGDFLRGFLSAARAIFLDSPTLMQMLNQHIMALDGEAFLAALPSLRFAFTTLSPRETFSLSQQLSGDSQTPISVGEHIPQSTLDNAYALQQQFIPLFASWGEK